jgi:VTC domain/Domain of unknown function (DUF202)
MTNTYPIKEKKKEMLESGKSQREADEWEILVTEITQAIAAKQLVPTVRTQYMRTAFQIPFDATVRASLDTNLCMISEHGYDLEKMKVWHRDPSAILAKHEITRFPHAILEIKLQLKGDNMVYPKWLTNLQNSGMLYEVHKFSKFIHGCSVLLPEEVRVVPYWIDDVSIRNSIKDSGAERILMEEDVGVGPGANKIYKHLLPFGDTAHNRMDTAVGRTHVSIAAAKGLKPKAPAVDKYEMGLYLEDDEENPHLEEEEEKEEDSDCGQVPCIGWLFFFCSRSNIEYEAIVAPTSVQKIEPKILFANERTYLHWLHYSVILTSVASGILAFSRKSRERWALWYAITLFPLALGFAVYALHIFLWRADRIKSRIPAHWDDRRGPFILGGVLAVVLTINFVTKLWHILTTHYFEAEL